MNIEDKLPKAEDVLKETGLEMSNFISYADYGAALKAMHEYTKRVLDVVAESGNIKTDEIRHALQLIEERIDKENYNTDLKEAWNLISYQLTAIEDHLKSISTIQRTFKV